MSKDASLVLKQTEEFVRSTFDGDGTGHDWWHIYRVWRSAVTIGAQENVDLFVVQLAALLHDLDDYKVQAKIDSSEPALAREWLERIEIDKNTIDHVCEIIRDLCFKGSDVESRMKTREGMVVQDADRLDAIGAIGIARTFAYGGSKGRPMYDPDIKPVRHTSFDEYKTSTGTTLNHFYEKLLLLKSLMNTKTAKHIAQRRHEFMEEFLARFYKEWEGQD